MIFLIFIAANFIENKQFRYYQLPYTSSSARGIFPGIEFHQGKAYKRGRSAVLIITLEVSQFLMKILQYFQIFLKIPRIFPRKLGQKFRKIMHLYGARADKPQKLAKLSKSEAKNQLKPAIF